MPKVFLLNLGVNNNKARSDEEREVETWTDVTHKVST